MNRNILPVSHPQLTSLDLEAFVSQAEALNQRNQETFPPPLSQELSPLDFPLSVLLSSHHLYRQGCRGRRPPLARRRSH
jgi:hypothetical protein